jgi:hypothetical protein
MHYILSLSDVVVALKLSGEPLDSNLLKDERRLKAVFWNMGLDINHRYVGRFCKHRNIQNQIVTCVRLEGSERSDKHWLASGHATPRNSQFAEEAQEMLMPNVSSTVS